MVPAASQDAGGSDVDSAHSHLSLEHVRAMGIVKTRLLTVHEDQEIDGKDLPDWEKLDEAKRMVEECEEYCANLARNWEKASSVEERMALGATACPEGGQVAPAPAVDGDLERVMAMISSAEIRLLSAKAEAKRLQGLRANGGDGVPASGGDGGDPAHWHAGFDTDPPADGQDRSAPCVICPLVLFLR